MPSKDAPISIYLPPTYTLDRMLHDRSDSSQLTYRIDRTFQAFQQVLSLANVLFYPLLSLEPVFRTVTLFSEHTIWLLDTLVDIRALRWQGGVASSTSPLRAIEMAMGVFDSLFRVETTPSALLSKAATLLIMLCSEMASHLEESPLLATADLEAQRTYCLALIMVSKAAIHDRSIARLAASKLVEEPLVLFPTRVEDSDVWVSIPQLWVSCTNDAVEVHTDSRASDVSVCTGIS